MRTISIARVNHVIQNQQRILEPLPPSDPGLFNDLSSLRVHGQFASLTDAIANMLGYVSPESTPRNTHIPNDNARVKPENDKRYTPQGGKVLDPDIQANNASSISVATMEIASNVEDVKPSVIHKKAVVNTLANDSDDDSIPGAVNFKKK